MLRRLPRFLRRDWCYEADVRIRKAARKVFEHVHVEESGKFACGLLAPVCAVFRPARIFEQLPAVVVFFEQEARCVEDSEVLVAGGLGLEVGGIVAEREQGSQQSCRGESAQQAQYPWQPLLHLGLAAPRATTLRNVSNTARSAGRLPGVTHGQRSLAARSHRGARWDTHRFSFS